LVIYDRLLRRINFWLSLRNLKGALLVKHMVSDISVDLLSVLQRLGRALVRTQAGLGWRTTARPGDLTRLNFYLYNASSIILIRHHTVEVSKQRVMAVFDQIDI
jgi:hypothetical protein